MGLGERGKHRMEKKAPKVNELFKPTEGGNAESGEAAGEIPARPVGRPRGREAVKVKSFALPISLNQRLRRFAFERECSEVDVVRAALERYLDAQEDK